MTPLVAIKYKYHQIFLAWILVSVDPFRMIVINFILMIDQFDPLKSNLLVFSMQLLPFFVELGLFSLELADLEQVELVDNEVMFGVGLGVVVVELAEKSCGSVPESRVVKVTVDCKQSETDGNN